jgi:opacity protein-like surface antigen
MKSIKLFLIIIFIVFSNAKVDAQHRFGIYGGGGTTWYYGDMNDRILTHEKLFRYFFHAGIEYRVNQRIYLNADFSAGKIVGADSLAKQYFNHQRDLSFNTDYWQGALLINYRLRYGSHFNPYLIFGVGYFHFNPKRKFGDTEVELQPLGTEGQYINEDGYPKPYSLYTLSIPLGLGVEIPLNKDIALRLEIQNHYIFTDYLDDLSTKYADSTKLANTPNGALAVQLASNLSTGYPRGGASRGSSTNKDSYSTFGASVVYFFARHHATSSVPRNQGVGMKKKKKKNHCPAYN